MEYWSVGESDTRPSSAGNENWDQRYSPMYGPQEHWTITPVLQYSNTPTDLGFLMAELNFSDPRNPGDFYVQLKKLERFLIIRGRPAGCIFSRCFEDRHGKT